jgi:hypothetical protein
MKIDFIEKAEDWNVYKEDEDFIVLHEQSKIR